MAIADPTDFRGHITGDGVRVETAIAAGIDDQGALTLTLDPFMPSVDTFALRRGLSRGQESRSFTLEGVSLTGVTFFSDSFYITGWRRAEGRLT